MLTCQYLYIKHSKHELPFLCLWKCGTLSPLNTMFICTLQTSSTKIILLTSTLHPRRASIHTVNFGGSPGLPLGSIWSTQACDTTIEMHITEMLPCFLHVVNRKGGTTYFERLKNYFVKQTKYSVNTVDLGPFRLPQPLVKLKAEVEDLLHWKRSSLILLLTSRRSVAFVFYQLVVSI